MAGIAGRYMSTLRGPRETIAARKARVSRLSVLRGATGMGAVSYYRVSRETDAAAAPGTGK
jgi:hypothetical protein